MARSIKSSIKIEGLKELEDALLELPKSVQGNVLKRAAVAAAADFAEHAQRLAPKDKGKLSREIKVAKPKMITAGKGAFAAAMKEGSTPAEAAQAARAANRAAGGRGRAVITRVGPTKAAFYGLFQEFGTAHHAARPFMRPTWDALKNSMLDTMKEALASEIAKAAARAAKRAAKRLAQIK